MPLFDRMDLFGVLELINKRGGPFDAADLALVQASCQAASLTLRALRLESTVDKVTAHNASILENLGGGFVAIDAHGRLMLCNPAAKKLLELPDDLAMGQPIDQSLLAIPEMGEILMDTLVKKETVKRQDLWWKRKGEPRVLGYSTLLIQDPHGQVVGAGITFQDITQFQKK
jgi:PAS domain S-box-containing protein